MPIIGDMRARQFKGRKLVYGEIINTGFYPDTKLILHGKRPTGTEGYVVRMYKKTIQRLRRLNAYKRGLILMSIYQDRPEVFVFDRGVESKQGFSV